MNDRVPAEVFAPGEFLKEELDARGWSQIELAEVLSRPPRLISEIIAGKRAITPETAKGLSAAFGQSAQYWMNLETAYQLSKARIEEREVKERARLYSTFPVKEMIKRGWVEASENLDVLVQRYLEYFRISNLNETPTFSHAPRKSGDSILQIAWLNRAAQIAPAISCAKYSKKALENVVPQLRACMEYPDDLRKVSQILASAGVRLVIVEYLPGMKMDGACFWINDGASPVIALSMKFDRIDNFWFNLFHEIDHVLHGEGKDQAICEEITPGSSTVNPIEQRANAAASNYCVPDLEMNDFVARVQPMFSKASIVGFARRIHVHPGIVAGQLHGRGIIPPSHHREMLEKVRNVITASVLTDGFGNKVSL